MITYQSPLTQIALPLKEKLYAEDIILLKKQLHLNFETASTIKKPANRRLFWAYNLSRRLAYRSSYYMLDSTQRCYHHGLLMFE